MARLLVSDLVDEITDTLPSAATVKIVRAANKVILRIFNEVSLPEYGTFTTRVKITSGTVAVTQDSTTATFSGTPLLTTDPFQIVQIEGDDAWFTLTPSSTSVGALGSKWAAATDATATYTLVFPTVSFPKEVGSILRIWRDGERDLKFAADRGSIEGFAFLNVTGAPQYFSPYLHDSASAAPSDDLLRYILTPAPESREVLSYSFKRRPTLLVQTGGTLLTQAVPLPDAWNETIVAGTQFWMWDQRDKQERSKYWRGMYEDAFMRAKASLNPGAVVPAYGNRRSRGMWIRSPNPTGP